MNLNNIKNFKVNNIPFKGPEKRQEVQLTFEQIMKRLVKLTSSYFSFLTEKEVPLNGKFSPVSFSFEIPRTSNVGRFCTEYSVKNPENERILSLGVRHKNSDRLTSVYLTKGSKEDIIKYLKNEENYSKIEKLLAELSKDTNDYFNSL